MTTIESMLYVGLGLVAGIYITIMVMVFGVGSN